MEMRNGKESEGELTATGMNERAERRHDHTPSNY